MRIRASFVHFALLAAAVLALAPVCARCAEGETSLTSPGAKAGERRVIAVEGVEFPFRWAPAGTFQMGSPENEEYRESGEILHEVRLTKGFWILETEVTQQMWGVVEKENPSKFKGEKKPVDTVSASDCDRFCAEFSKLAKLPEGFRFTLPTEAQWEYAARAGRSGAESGATGGQALAEIAWFGDEDYGGTHDVGTKKPNAWGICDMLGNLWEWCADRTGDYKKDADGKGLAVVDPTGADAEETPVDIRVDRGGCWDSHDYECRLAYRGYYDGDRKGPYVGFRFVLTVPESGSER